MARYSFPVGRFSPLPYAGLSRRSARHYLSHSAFGVGAQRRESRQCSRSSGRDTCAGRGDPEAGGQGPRGGDGHGSGHPACFGRLLRRLGNGATVHIAGVAGRRGDEFVSFEHVVPARVAAEALPLYLRAVALLRRDNSSYQPALRLLEEASKLDSSSPLIQASFAEAWLQAFRASRDARWLRPAEERQPVRKPRRHGQLAQRN